jgi:hypothetical protein
VELAIGNISDKLEDHFIHDSRNTNGTSTTIAKNLYTPNIY